VGELVRHEVSGGVARIVLDSPANRNALSRRLVAELDEALDEAERDGARVVVLGHEGTTFCAGADLKERSDGPVDSRPMVRVLARLADGPLPTIAAVAGAVRAGGIGLMAACDLVVVARDVTFAFTEVRIGVAPAIISVPILSRTGASRAAAAFLTGEVFAAPAALAMGLVTHVADDAAGVAATAEALAAGVLAGAPGAVAATKSILRRVPGLDRPTAYEEMRRLSEELFSSAEAAEGMAAFRERRDPSWRAGA